MLEQFLPAHLDTLRLLWLLPLLLHSSRARRPRGRRSHNGIRLAVTWSSSVAISFGFPGSVTIGFNFPGPVDRPFVVDWRTDGDAALRDLHVDVALVVVVDAATPIAVGCDRLRPLCGLLYLVRARVETDAAEGVCRDELGAVDESALERVVADLDRVLRLLIAGGLVQGLATSTFYRLSKVGNLKLRVSEGTILQDA